MSAVLYLPAWLRVHRSVLWPGSLTGTRQYILSRMHLGVPSRKPPAKSWWKDPALCTGRFRKKDFVASILQHWADQDEPAMSNPPTLGYLHRPTQPHHQPKPAANGRQIFHDKVMTRKGDSHET